MMLLLEAVAVALALVSLSDLYICNSSAGRLHCPCRTEIGPILCVFERVVPRLSRTHCTVTSYRQNTLHHVYVGRYIRGEGVLALAKTVICHHALGRFALDVVSEEPLSSGSVA